MATASLPRNSSVAGRVFAAGAIAAAIFMLAAGGTFRQTVYFPVMAIQHVLLFALCMVASSRVPMLARITRGPDRLFSIAAVTTIAYIVARATLTPYPRFAGPAVFAVIAGVAATVVAAHHFAASSQVRRQAAITIALLGGGVSAYALYDWLLRETPRAAMPLGHHNMLGGFLCLVLPVQVLIALSAGFRKWERVGATAAAALSIVALVGSESLGSAIGILAAVPAVGLAALAARWMDARRSSTGGMARGESLNRSSVLAKGAIALAVFCAILAVSAQTGPGQRIQARLVHLVSGAGDRSGTERVEFAKGALAGVLATHPLIGFGPGMTPLAFPLDLRQRVIRQAEGVAVTHLHSTPVQTTYELGIIGFVLTTLTGILAALAMLRRLLRSEQKSSDRTIVLAIIGAGVAYGIRCLTDVNLLALAVPYTGCVLLGLGLAVPLDAEESWADRHTDEQDASALPWWRLSPVRTILSSLVYIPALALSLMLLRIDIAHYWADAGYAKIARLAGEQQSPAMVHRLLERASSDYRTAHRVDPKLGFYAFEAGLVQEALAETSETDNRAAARYSAAADTLLAEAMLAVPTAPGFALHLGARRLNIAIRTQRSSDLERALEPLSLAATIECRSAFALPLLARWRVESGDIPGALELYREIISQRPVCVCGEDIYRDAVRPFIPDLITSIREEDERVGALLEKLYDSCGDSTAITERPVLQRMDDQNPWKSRSLYLFRRRGLTTFSAPFMLRSTAESRHWNRTPSSMKLHAQIARRIGPVRARDILDRRFPQARYLLPPEFLSPRDTAVGAGAAPTGVQAPRK